LFGILTPIFFTVYAAHQKHLASDRIGFKPQEIAFNSVLFTNIFIMIGAIVYWNIHGFNKRLFWIGLIASIFDTIGKVTS